MFRRVWVSGKNEKVNEAVRRNIARHFDEVTMVRPELVISLGGDGSIIHAANTFPGVPILPINIGATDALMVNVKADELDRAVKKASAGSEGRDYEIKEEMRVEGSFKNIILEGVNEVYFLRNHPYSNRYRISYKGELHPEYREFVKANGEKPEKYDDVLMGDGVIVCSPFGSSAYSHSSGGIIFDAPGLGVTPMASTHTMEKKQYNSRWCYPVARPIILCPKSEVRVDIARGGENLFVGDVTEFKVMLHEGDRIVFRKAREPMRLVRLI